MRTRRTFLLASVLFLISGALGLGYQLIWIRKATLLVGSSQLAYATTVASFFLGLALGSAFVGRYLRSRRRSPLFVYGIFEAIIGV
jgi:spermidine synthase